RRLDQYKIFIQEILYRQGPEFDEYHSLLKWYEKVGKQYQSGWLGRGHLEDLVQFMGEIYLSTTTLAGKLYITAQDPFRNHLLLDQIYHHQTTSDPGLIKWDQFFHWTLLAESLREIKDYFITTLENEIQDSQPLNLLLLGSDMARSLEGILAIHTDDKLNATLLSHDPEAITFARSILNGRGQTLQYIEQNILSVNFDPSFDLTWGSLYPNLLGEEFGSLLLQLIQALRPGGQAIFSFFLAHPSTLHLLAFTGWELSYPTLAGIQALCQDILPPGYEVRCWGNKPPSYGLLEIKHTANSQPLISKL
ncbi:MAG: hypothetical protein AAF388_08420, partial [Bacteroidota bacterium]